MRWARAESHTRYAVSSTAKQSAGTVEILSHLAEHEAKGRAKRSLDRRLARAKLGRFAPMADFDWAWPTRIDRDAVEDALKLGKRCTERWLRREAISMLIGG